MQLAYGTAIDETERMTDRDDAPEHDRQAIMARRAIFVTTAIAALSCSSQGPEGTGTSSVVDPPVTATATVTQTATASGTTTTAPTGSVVPATPDNAKATWEDRRKAAPPLEVGASVKGAEKEQLDRLAKTIGPLYDKLGAAWIAVPPDCAPKDARCSAQWTNVANALGELDDELQGPNCGYSEGLAFMQRVGAHHVYLRALMSELEKRLGDQALALKDATSWQKLMQSGMKPQPCLKCAMREPTGLFADGLALTVNFKEGDSKVDASSKDTIDKIKARLGEIKDGVFQVRGHADPSEPGDKAALAKARAESVRDALVKAGVPKARLTIVAYGSDLPIGPTGTDMGKAQNRRVDFETPKPKAP